jgi:hypothetical protein
MVGKGALAALAFGLAGAASPHELYQDRPPLVQLSLHLGVNQLTEDHRGKGPILLHAITRLSHLTHLHLQLGGPPYCKESRTDSSYAHMPPKEPPPNQGAWLALQAAIQDWTAASNVMSIISKIVTEDQCAGLAHS